MSAAYQIEELQQIEQGPIARPVYRRGFSSLASFIAMNRDLLQRWHNQLARWGGEFSFETHCAVQYDIARAEDNEWASGRDDRYAEDIRPIASPSSFDEATGIRKRGEI
jgi:hypothetical protein